MNGERAYTQAPWKLSHTGQQIHGPRGQWIANIKCESCPAHEAGNAALIAAAPELLEALNGLLGAYDAAVAQLSNKPPTDHPASWRAIAAAAVRKACPGAERTKVESQAHNPTE